VKRAEDFRPNHSSLTTQSLAISSDAQYQGSLLAFQLIHDVSTKEIDKSLARTRQMVNRKNLSSKHDRITNQTDHASY